jgi:large subunit ribosomal protein L18
MAKNSRYCAPFRRRREGKTDYKARKALVLSGKPRLTVRTSISNIIAQVIVAKPSGDEVLASAHSRELAKSYGWKASGGNLPAAYLTGFLCGQKAKAKGIEETILDIGLHSPSKGARVFAVLKGVLDSGLNVPYSEDKLPEPKRLEGEHIAAYAKSLVSNVEVYQSKFSRYLRQGLSPETFPKHFAEVKTNIKAAVESGGKKK